MNRLFVFTLLLIGFFSNAQQGFCDKITLTFDALHTYHYQSKKIDDSLSVNIFTTFLDSYDKGISLFTQAEFDKIKIHRLKIDDYILAKNCAFLTDFKEAIHKGLQRKEQIYNQFLTENFVYDSKETIQYYKKKPDYYTTDLQVISLLKRRIKQDILTEIASISKNKDSLKSVFKTLEKDIKKRCIDREKCLLSHQLSAFEGDGSGFENQFLQSVVLCFDPHSNYFSTNEKEQFLNQVSEDNATYGIDFQLDEKNDFYVAEIIPGSAAFANEKIELQDKLIKISDSKSTDYWANCSNFTEIFNQIYSAKNQNLTFYFEKKDGTKYQAVLEKKSMKAMDNKCFSFVIEKEGFNFGYLKIPSFYSDGLGTNFLSNDLALQLINLQKENIKGLVIDLENNGGGDMEEAIKVCGMFIDVGPVAQAAQKNEPIMPIKDINRGMNYNGPLVVMINGNSASASEFFANAIQDYKRGIIVGQRSFGKATIQNIIPLDSLQSNDDFLKITVGKFYRITGKSNQKTGVIPDVLIPNIYENYIQHEDDLEFCLANMPITSNLRYQLWYKDLTGAIEKEKSSIAQNIHANDVKKCTETFDKSMNIEGLKLSLDFENIFTFVHKNDDLYKEIEVLEQKIHIHNLRETTTDAQKYKDDTLMKEINTKRIKELKTNFSLSESINLLFDLN